MIHEDKIEKFIWFLTCITYKYFLSSRCRYVVNKAFESWNDQDYNRRFYQIQLLIDTPDDYQPAKQVRSTAKKNISSSDSKIPHKKPKKPKATAIKCNS
jgi:hypothetical protein